MSLLANRPSRSRTAAPAVVAAVVAVATLALVLAGMAAAATWTWTEVKAESWAGAHVTYFDEDAWLDHQQDIELRRAKTVQCKDPASAHWAAQPYSGCATADQEYQAALTEPRSDYVLYPRAVDCRGASPSRDAYHFWRFRCRAQFSVGWANVRVTVTGKNRAVWRLI
jgi:hypothetical protein